MAALLVTVELVMVRVPLTLAIPAARCAVLLFTVLLVGVILIVGALTFFPALSLGPLLEHLLMNAGKTF